MGGRLCSNNLVDHLDDDIRVRIGIEDDMSAMNHGSGVALEQGKSCHAQ
jgi:hypothetical protein